MVKEIDFSSKNKQTAPWLHRFFTNFPANYHIFRIR